MNGMKETARLWPIAFAALGVAGLVYAGFRWLQPYDGTVEDQAPERTTDPGPNEHFEPVRVRVVDESTTYAGKVHAEGSIPVRAPQGMRVPIVRIHHEPGDFVKRGDALVTFAR